MTVGTAGEMGVVTYNNYGFQAGLLKTRGSDRQLAHLSNFVLKQCSTN